MIKKLYTVCSGQNMLPALSTLPAYMAVVYRERMDLGGRQRPEQVVERCAIFKGKDK